MKKLGSSASINEDNGFQLPSHLESNFSPEESAEVLADHFSSISQEFDPIDPSKFSPALQNKLRQSTEIVPILEEYQVYRKILSSKKPNSSVPGDIPKKVVSSFAVELAKPIKTIFNTITTTAE